MESNETLITKVVDCLTNKKGSSGYFFIINEVVHPMYLGIYDEGYSIETAWEVLCNSFLNLVYKTDMKSCLKHVIRGKVEDNRVFTGNPAPYYDEQLKFCFKLPKIEIVPCDDYEVVTSLSEKDKPKVEKLYKNFDYFSSLPWTVRFELVKYNTVETKSVQARAFTERYSITKRILKTKETIKVV